MLRPGASRVLPSVDEGGAPRPWHPPWRSAAGSARGSALATHCGWPRHHGTRPPAAAVADALSSIDLGLHGECGAADALDGMTYAWVDVRHPDKTEFVRVRTLVDTGSTDCELKADVIRRLGLPATGETAHFETAVGRVTEQPIYEAVIRVLGREARVVLSPADGDESDDESDESDEAADQRPGVRGVSDEGMLGHTALAALNLAVDCRKRRLVALPEHPFPLGCL